MEHSDVFLTQAIGFTSVTSRVKKASDKKQFFENQIADLSTHSALQ